MLTAENWTEHLVESLPAKPYRILFSWAPASDPIDIVTRWTWAGILGAHTYAVGASPSELRSAPLMMSDDVAAFSEAERNGRPLIAEPLRVPCDGVPYAIPTGARATWLRLSPSVVTHIVVDPAMAPLLARDVIVLRSTPRAPNTQMHLACQGAPDLLIQSAVDADPPD